MIAGTAGVISGVTLVLGPQVGLRVAMSGGRADQAARAAVRVQFRTARVSPTPSRKAQAWVPTGIVHAAVTTHWTSGCRNAERLRLA
ncbi:hypothetical protein [Streptomyces sp. NPDC127092]|uniref:hypothetical protein n=1 Tax=Streptomyces sp. NPDC127092 TaxID=3347135 RepID=UPI0036630620